MVDHLFRFEPFSREAFIHNHHLILVGGFIWRNRTTLHGRMSIMRDLYGFGLHSRLPNFINNVLKDRSFKVGSLFNDALNTFYLRLHGVRTILIVRKETSCRHIGYSFLLTTRVLWYAPSDRQDSTYHSLCYTSRGALAGTRNSSMGPPHEGSIRRPIIPWANALTTELHPDLLNSRWSPYSLLLTCKRWVYLRVISCQ